MSKVTNHVSKIARIYEKKRGKEYLIIEKKPIFAK